MNISASMIYTHGSDNDRSEWFGRICRWQLCFLVVELLFLSAWTSVAMWVFIAGPKELMRPEYLIFPGVILYVVILWPIVYRVYRERARAGLATKSGAVETTRRMLTRMTIGMCLILVGGAIWWPSLTLFILLVFIISLWTAWPSSTTFGCPTWSLPDVPLARFLRSWAAERSPIPVDIRVIDSSSAKAGQEIPPAAYLGLRQKLIVFSDSMLKILNGPQVLAIFAHELAHHRLGHGSWKNFGIRFLPMLAGLAGAAVVLLWLGVSDGVQALAIAPMFLLGVCLACFAARPLSNARIRAKEREATALALEMTADGNSFIIAMQKLREGRPEPRLIPRWQKLLFVDSLMPAEIVEQAEALACKFRETKTVSQPSTAVEAFRPADILEAIEAARAVWHAPQPAATVIRGPNGFGIAALVLGIVSLLLPFWGILAGILAMVFAKVQRLRHPTESATAGLVLGAIGTCLWLFLLATVLFLPWAGVFFMTIITSS